MIVGHLLHIYCKAAWNFSRILSSFESTSLITFTELTQGWVENCTSLWLCMEWLHWTSQMISITLSGNLPGWLLKFWDDQRHPCRSFSTCIWFYSNELCWQPCLMPQLMQWNLAFTLLKQTSNGGESKIEEMKMLQCKEGTGFFVPQNWQGI
jgi:hypothetical protein